MGRNYNVDARTRFLVAKVEYLSANGWVPMVPLHPDAPVLWCTAANFSEDEAFALQEKWDAEEEEARALRRGANPVIKKVEP